MKNTNVLVAAAISWLTFVSGCGWSTWSAHPEVCPCDGSPCGEDEESGDHIEEGEESGIQYEKSETLDEVFNGARLVMNFDEDADLFEGTVENTTADILCDVRVEVHLDDGSEIGPTTPVNLAVGEVISVELSVDLARDGEEGGEEH